VGKELITVDLSLAGQSIAAPPAGSYVRITGKYAVRLGMTPYWTAANSPQGTFDFYGSNDFDPNAPGGPTGNWTKITSKFSSKVDPDGSTTSNGFAFGDWYDYGWFCVIYNRTGGGSGDVAKFPLVWRG
jgi:hypothetical protein